MVYWKSLHQFSWEVENETEPKIIQSASLDLTSNTFDLLDKKSTENNVYEKNLETDRCQMIKLVLLLFKTAGSVFLYHSVSKCKNKSPICDNRLIKASYLEECKYMLMEERDKCLAQVHNKHGWTESWSRGPSTSSPTFHQ